MKINKREANKGHKPGERSPCSAAGIGELHGRVLVHVALAYEIKPYRNLICGLDR